MHNPIDPEEQERKASFEKTNAIEGSQHEKTFQGNQHENASEASSDSQHEEPQRKDQKEPQEPQEPTEKKGETCKKCDKVGSSFFSNCVCDCKSSLRKDALEALFFALLRLTFDGICVLTQKGWRASKPWLIQHSSRLETFFEKIESNWPSSTQIKEAISFGIANIIACYHAVKQFILSLITESKEMYSHISAYCSKRCDDLIKDYPTYSMKMEHAGRKSQVPLSARVREAQKKRQVAVEVDDSWAVEEDDGTNFIKQDPTIRYFYNHRDIAFILAIVYFFAFGGSVARAYAFLGLTYFLPIQWELIPEGMWYKETDKYKIRKSVLVLGAHVGLLSLVVFHAFGNF
ncbi:hypothetical protein BJ508DRAFT_419622 [Ascobolus immersus RN42]|uniref:Uncharacterized protein n=1 Tax=Ascobolus immersus RN42 TaxID=1160509 RepID=A0A3N4HCU2_ASCIM|nr:hypothetical protein BJ508DRAFT_419622 [Ascobolus immersus RN42]